MVHYPVIYTVQATDAAQHAAKLQEILQHLKAASRIGSFASVGQDDDPAGITSKIQDDDLILLLLTTEFEPQKERWEAALRTLKSERPRVRIAEVIVDKVVYDNEFLAFPADLKPIREREDMDAVWKGIEQSLQDIFPVLEEEKKPVAWKKYATYAAIILALALVGWLLSKLGGGGPNAAFSYYVGDNTDQDSITACYPPCDVQFINESQDYDSSQWVIGDTTLTNKHIRLKFVQPGDVKIALTVFSGNKKNTLEKTLLVKTPPVAAFEAANNGCTAPCEIKFNNTSEHATGYQWNFGNGQTSTERQAEATFNTAGEYTVTLVARNDEGITAETKQKISVIADDSPFADFTFTGSIGKLNRTVKFKNTSKNAHSYVWQFPGGTPAASSSANPSVTYSSYNTYAVTLTAKKSDGRSHQQVKTVSVREFPILIQNFPIFEIQPNKTLDKYKVLEYINP